MYKKLVCLLFVVFVGTSISHAKKVIAHENCIQKNTTDCIADFDINTSIKFDQVYNYFGYMIDFSSDFSREESVKILGLMAKTKFLVEANQSFRSCLDRLGKDNLVLSNKYDAEVSPVEYPQKLLDGVQYTDGVERFRHKPQDSKVICLSKANLENDSVVWFKGSDHSKHLHILIDMTKIEGVDKQHTTKVFVGDLLDRLVALRWDGPYDLRKMKNITRTCVNRNYQ